MSITYTYKIIAVDEAARCMEVRYEANDLPPINIGARLPYKGEPLEDIIKMYSPIAFWESLRLVVTPPEVGHEGVIAPEVTGNPASFETEETMPKVIL